MSLTTLAASHLDALSRANQAFSAVYPGDRPARQPVHTVYGGAQLYKAETTRRLGELGLASLAAYARDARDFAGAVGLKGPSGTPPDDAFCTLVHERVKRKLEREAVEDFRIDFEDGFGA